MPERLCESLRESHIPNTESGKPAELGSVRNAECTYQHHCTSGCYQPRGDSKQNQRNKSLFNPLMRLQLFEEIQAVSDVPVL